MQFSLTNPQITIKKSESIDGDEVSSDENFTKEAIMDSKKRSTVKAQPLKPNE